jgi:DNA-binding NtrC family response regulator
MSAKPLTILVIDDEPAVREVLSLRIEDWGYRVHTASDTEELEEVLDGVRPDLIISDVVLPGISGLDLLPRLKADDPARPVLLITAHGSIDAAVEAKKRGALEYLNKPLDSRRLRYLIDEAGWVVGDQGETRALEARLERGAGLGALVGESRPMRKLCRLVETLASSDASAILTGESGTGKEVVAQTIHELSNRRAGPFIAVNAAAIPEGLIESELFGHEKGAFTGAVQSRPGCFEEADGGTLLLDEIGEMPISLQPKLLRILEDGGTRRLGGSRDITFDVRVIAATNRDPAAAIRSGLLREDLFYRLNVFEVAVPPLRERLDDVPLLAQHFIRQFSLKHQMPVEGLRDRTHALLRAYPWPGNVRELRNVIERSVIIARSGWIEPTHLPPYLRGNLEGGDPTITLPVGISAAEAEKTLILRTLEHVGQNKAEAARRLELDVKTIRNKLRAYGLTDTEP